MKSRTKSKKPYPNPNPSESKWELLLDWYEYEVYRVGWKRGIKCMSSNNIIGSSTIASFPILKEEIVSPKFSTVELHMTRLRIPSIKEGTSGDGPSAVILLSQVNQSLGLGI